MSGKPRIVFVLIAGSLLYAADQPWATKRVAEWTDTDALQVLSDSPWAKRSTPTILAALTAFERRDGGNIGAQGGGQGMRLDRIPEAVNPFGTTGAKVRPGQGPESKVEKLPIRWETALPIRAAEFKSNESGVPNVDGEDYAVAIYDVSFKLASIDKTQLKDLSKELKKISVLKIEGRPEGTQEVRPDRVAVIEVGSGTATVVYMFPRSAHITQDDKRIEFDAQIGRIAVAQYFYPPEMRFQGKLEL
ncbi:MAG TPA: hypothetical protein VK789_01690 [Bryobacteraceae bacterium]|jgi:hypothetical protein|nr:hypothetical protein [Bryobacteraceae bacterium]